MEKIKNKDRLFGEKSAVPMSARSRELKIRTTTSRSFQYHKGINPDCFLSRFATHPIQLFPIARECKYCSRCTDNQKKICTLFFVLFVLSQIENFVEKCAVKVSKY